MAHRPGRGVTRITDVEAVWLRVPALDVPCEWGEDAFIVRIKTDGGIVGVGESDSSPAVLKAIVETPSSHVSCRGLREILVGENPLDIGRLWRRMREETAYMGGSGLAMHAMSAIDIALWDIAGQHAGLPVHQLLGGKLREVIPAYGTFVPDTDPGTNRETVARLLATGLTCLKFGGGQFGFDAAHDRTTVEAIRDAVGPDCHLAIDVLHRWRDFATAKRRAADLSALGLAWIEEPLPPDDHAGLRQLSESIGIPVSGGEGLSTAAEFAEFVRETRPAIVQPDITRCGGFTGIRQVADIAGRHGTRLVPHGFSTGILLAATVQFLASQPGGDLIEYPQSASPLATSLVLNRVPLEGGKVRVGDEPGLGVKLDEDMLERYRVDVVRRSKWR